MNILILAASAQGVSVNKKLAAAIGQLIAADGSHGIDIPDFKDFSMPMYDGDLEQASGVPATAQALAVRIQQADALIVCTPEYNGSIPGGLKNTLDWLSRLRPHPLVAKPVLLTGASPGALGAIRGLWHTRVPFEALGALVYPEMFGLSAANEAFDEEGLLKDARKSDQVNKLLDNFLGFAASVRNA
jgi:chromate reductase